MHCLGLLLALLSASPHGAHLNHAQLGQIIQMEDDRDPRGTLTEHLDAPDQELRRRAALALGRIGSPDRSGVLVRALRKEPEPHVREILCLALGLTQRPEAIPVLSGVLAHDPAVAVRARAAQALGFIPGPMALEALLAAAPTAKEEEALAWPVATALLRHKDARAADALALLVESDRTTAVRAGTWGLARLKVGAGAQALHRAFRSNDPYVQAWAIRGLGDRKAATAGELSHALASANHLVRLHGIGAAGNCSERGSVPRLIQLAQEDPDPNLRVEAMVALGKIPDARGQSVACALRTGPGVLARAADVALARWHVSDGVLFAQTGLGPPAGTAGWTVLDWVSWVEAVGHARGKRAREQLGMLAAGRAGVTDPGRVIVAAAVNAIGENATAPDRARLVSFADDPDPLVRASAITPLLKLGNPLDLTQLAARYERALKDPVEDFRVAAVGAVAQRKEPAALAVLTRAASDPSRHVRALARAALTARGIRPAGDLGKVGAQPAPGYYAQLAAGAHDRQTARILTSRGTFTITLLSDKAPITVENFRRLAKAHYFDGLLISRVVPEFVVQMGDNRGDLSGSPGYTIRCEINDLAYERGAVGMALDGKDTGGSQFFVTLARQPHLDAAYTIFGMVTDGMGVVDHLQKGDRIRTVEVSNGHLTW